MIQYDYLRSAPPASTPTSSQTPTASKVSIYLPLSPDRSKTPLRARTDRQMQIEQKIIELQGRFITACGSMEEKSRVRAGLHEKIEKLKDLRESKWAYGGEGGIPEDLID
ncbi:hypothetical protein PM082_009556 [Marasmius tenuissimus]|nr:hypothetical protein PM082_009556 [Marasmius tenuissimus]